MANDIKIVKPGDVSFNLVPAASHPRIMNMEMRRVTMDSQQQCVFCFNQTPRVIAFKDKAWPQWRIAYICDFCMKLVKATDTPFIGL